MPGGRLFFRSDVLVVYRGSPFFVNGLSKSAMGINEKPLIQACFLERSETDRKGGVSHAEQLHLVEVQPNFSRQLAMDWIACTQLATCMGT